MEIKTVDALKKGDYRTFTKVFNLFWEKVYFYYIKKTKHPDVAKELTQLVFIKLWKYRECMSNTISLDEQIFRKSKQVFIDWLRQEARKRKLYVEREPLPDNEVAVNDNYDFEVKKDVYGALRALPPKRKEIFELKHIYGYSYKEIAELLGISVKTVDSQLLKANVQLRKILQTSLTAAILYGITCNTKIFF